MGGERPRLRAWRAHHGSGVWAASSLRPGCSLSSEPSASTLSFCVSVLALLPLVRILPLETEQMDAGITGGLGPQLSAPKLLHWAWLAGGGRESSHQALIHPERQSTTFFGTRSLRLSKLRTLG